MAEKAKWDAGLYDDKHSFVWKLAAGVLELLNAQSGERILDLGCGTGHLAAKIAETGAHVVGIDRSPEMIRQAKEKYPALRFEVMDAREIRLDGSFDAVFSNATLHWIKEPELAIAGIRNALRPGGRFIAEFGGKGNTGELMKAIERGWAKLQSVNPAPNPWYYPSIPEYTGLLERHGFEVTDAVLFDRPTPLDDGIRGLRNWLEMFGGSFVEGLPAAARENLLSEIERELRPKLFHDDQWVMDYRRLRVVAKRLN
ncbi:MAG TPA: methyltransferase domain-containing protein [Candidatus Acidoferrum sp.]|nr:methyltransferase domain-containing protein [Candidatus Acidoferrum sp.]